MIQINPNNMVKVELTHKEQKTVLTHCQDMDRDIYDRIQNARNGVIHLLIEDCYYLKGAIQAAIQTATKPKVQNILGTVFNKLSPNPTTKNIAEEIEGQDFDNIDALNEHLQGMMTNHNSSPDPDMGGLSPDQVNRLIYIKWDDNNFPLKFNKKLKLSDIKDATFFTNARIFLKTLIEMEKEPTATATGNLNRKIVKILFDKLILDEDDRISTLKYNKVINEDDVFRLHLIRIVCESAGIIHKRKNKILVVKKHHDIVSEGKEGELYHLLFNSYFRKFNIGYMDRLAELECIQETIAYSFYRLGEIADRWVGREELEEEILLPTVRKEVREKLSDELRIELVLDSRILRPLEGFGLLKCKYRKTKWRLKIEKIKKSKLFDKFVGRKW